LHERGHNVLCVGPGNTTLEVCEYAGQRFNYLPVFPVARTALARRLAAQNRCRSDLFLQVRYVREQHSACTDEVLYRTRQIILTKKLFGLSADDPIPSELQAKIARQYALHRPLPPRLGFIEGLSPYHQRADESPVRWLEGTVAKVDFQAHRLVLASGSTISFQRLVSTIPLPRLLRLVGAGDGTLRCVAESARFVMFSSTELLAVNQLTYDCEETSPLYRVFTPTDRIIVAQATHGTASTVDAIAASVREVLRLDSIPVFIAERRIDPAYPLAIEPSGGLLKLQAELARNGILLFGRFGCWEYKDLHELNWELVDDLDQRLR